MFPLTLDDVWSSIVNSLVIALAILAFIAYLTLVITAGYYLGRPLGNLLFSRLAPKLTADVRAAGPARILAQQRIFGACCAGVLWWMALLYESAIVADPAAMFTIKTNLLVLLRCGLDSVVAVCLLSAVTRALRLG